MMLSKAFVVLATAMTVTATRIHNNFGKNGWIQDNQGSESALNNGGSAVVGGGWGFFWVDSSVCGKNAVSWYWPSSYGDIYIHNDGFLYDAGGIQLSGGAHICG